MNIVVCVKVTPSTAAKIKVGASGVSIDKQGVEYEINPYDAFAIEAALQHVEANGGEVTLLSLGAEGSTKDIRNGLAMGAVKAVHLTDDNYELRDSFSVAKALADELKSLQWDAIFFGKQAVDSDNYQVPSMVSALLELPVANVCSTAEFRDGKFRAIRAVEGGTEIVELSAKCCISFTKGPKEPRFPTIPNIMKAKKKPLDQKAAPAVENRVKVTKLELPPPRPAGRIVGEGPEAAKELARLLREEAKVI
ncbi:MAG: electron transfer flavoprotein subunit beta/FixA family protein [Planctomycetes bacterium]|nr:electron transfer flavoprotein subunit beta/FixA family protein [Planctomycetota bacterium]